MSRSLPLTVLLVSIALSSGAAYADASEDRGDARVSGLRAIFPSEWRLGALFGRIPLEPTASTRTPELRPEGERPDPRGVPAARLEF